MIAMDRQDRIKKHDVRFWHLADAATEIVPAFVLMLYEVGRCY
jgi:hypothetical protein